MSRERRTQAERLLSHTRKRGGKRREEKGCLGRGMKEEKKEKTEMEGRIVRGNIDPWLAGEKKVESSVPKEKIPVNRANPKLALSSEMQNDFEIQL